MTPTLDFAALILAGGRSSRLGGTPKALLSNGETTLLHQALESARQATATVVVGPSTLPVPAKVLLTREDPPFSGPAAGISAGLDALASAHLHPQWVLLLAVDMPGCAPAVQTLLNAVSRASSATQGFMGVSAGIQQPLAGIYRYQPLQEVFSQDTANQSVRKFLNQLSPLPCELPDHSTADVDTWDAARELGFTRPTTPTTD